MVLGKVAIVIGSGTPPTVPLSARDPCPPSFALIFDSRPWRGFLYPLLGFCRFSLALVQRPRDASCPFGGWSNLSRLNCCYPLQIKLVLDHSSVLHRHGLFS
jgi:hypothetical protein